jgi:hypothetical protein
LTTTGGDATITLKFVINSVNGPNISCNGNPSSLSKSSFSVVGDQNGAFAPDYPKATYVLENGVWVYSVPVKISVPTNQYSITIKFGLSAPGYTFEQACTDNPLVTVSANASGFVTGGGFTVPANAGGTLMTGANGNKNNFGFNVKYNKANTQYQGNFNTIVRTSAYGVTRNFQVKSSQPNKLMVGQISPTSWRADIVYNSANIQDLTNGQGYGTGTVYLTVYDNGEPGTGVDQIYIKVVNNTGSTIYESSIGGPSNSTTQGGYKVPTLNGGNIQVHSLGGKLEVNNTSVRMIDQPAAQGLQLNALPNPSRGSFTLQLQGSTTEKMQVRVVDILGRTVQIFNNLSASQTLKIGADYKKGVYIVELVQGDSRTQTKLVKTD